MRQFFSFRFVATIGVLVGLLVLLVAAQSSGQPQSKTASATGEVERHKIDFVAHVESIDNPSFALTAEGTAAVDATFKIDRSRVVKIVAGTPGEIDCPTYAQPNQCAIVADLIGEAVVWFALVPNVTPEIVDLPAIDVLEGPLAVLVNGWELPYAPILSRRCPNQEWDSYRAFRAGLGDQFSSIYDVAEQRLVAVVCNQTVPWVTTTTAPPTTTTVPKS